MLTKKNTQKMISTWRGGRRMADLAASAESLSPEPTHATEGALIRERTRLANAQAIGQTKAPTGKR